MNSWEICSFSLENVCFYDSYEMVATVLFSGTSLDNTSELHSAQGLCSHQCRAVAHLKLWHTSIKLKAEDSEATKEKEHRRVLP
jgi:hypothetical protein